LYQKNKRLKRKKKKVKVSKQWQKRNLQTQKRKANGENLAGVYDQSYKKQQGGTVCRKKERHVRGKATRSKKGGNLTKKEGEEKRRDRGSGRGDSGR